tara:strand:+ start:498 stop:644 length:147 start_codon:yes stop_codon:yes gene_type:complete
LTSIQNNLKIESINESFRFVLKREIKMAKRRKKAKKKKKAKKRRRRRR